MQSAASWRPRALTIHRDKMLDTIKDMFSEAFGAITAETDREIGIFVIPLLVVVFLTAAQYAVYVNPNHTIILSTLQQSGVCNTYQPYLLTSWLTECQAVSFNVTVFMVWYLEIFAIIFAGIFAFEAITHMG